MVVRQGSWSSDFLKYQKISGGWVKT